MEDLKTSETQRRASRKWQEKNKSRAQHTNMKSKARVFIREHITLDELPEFEELIKARRARLEAQADD